MASGARPATPRLDSLTGLRWFAALAVFVHHFHGTSPTTGLAKVPLIYPETEYGAAGVTFFFILSGFVLVWSWREGGERSQFYWRRVARIYPSHLAGIVLAVPVFYFASGQPLTWTALLSVFLVQAWVPRLQPTFPGNPVSWTLSCEAFFYAMFPFLVAPLQRRTNRQLLGLLAGLAVVVVAVSAVVLALLTGKDQTWAFRTPLFTLWQFVLGMTLATVMRRGWRPPGWLWGWIALILLWVIVQIPVRFAIRAQLPALDFGLQVADRLVTPLLFAGAIGAAALLDIDGRRSIFRWRPLVLLGAWSYCFYLVHQTVIRCFQLTIGPQPEGNRNIGLLILVGVLAVAAAAALYYAVEQPCERRIREWARRRADDRADRRRPPLPVSEQPAASEPVTEPTGGSARESASKPAKTNGM